MQDKPRLPKNVWAMGFVSFFNDIASETIYPIIPIFLTSVLGAPVAIVGLIEGLAESTSSIVKVFSGWLSDKIRRRKPLVVVGYSVSTISKVIMGLATTWPLVLFARFLDRFGKGSRVAARDALIVESVTPEIRGRAFGLTRTLDSAGAVIGPLLALLLLAVFKDSYSTIFYIAAIPAAVGVVVLILLVKEARPAASKLHREIHLSDVKHFDPYLKVFMVVSGVFAIGNSSDAFLILRAKNLGLTTIAAVAAYVLFNITYSALSYPAGAWSDKIGPKKILAIGFGLFAVVYAALAITHQSFWLWFIFPVYGFYMALTDGVSKSYIASMVGSEISGTAFGLQQTIVGLGAFVASLTAGVLWHTSPSLAFWLGSAMAVVALVIFLSYRKKPVPA